METVLKFIDWFKMKIRLDSAIYKPPLVSERDIWWISLGKNVGSEINGKSHKFSRPGIILNKLSGSFYLIAPTTTREHKGNWYVKIRQSQKESYVCLHQVRTIDYRRLLEKLGQIDESDFKQIKQCLMDLYK